MKLTEGSSTNLDVVGELQQQLALLVRVLHGVAALGGILLVHALRGTLKVLPVLQEHHDQTCVFRAASGKGTQRRRFGVDSIAGTGAQVEHVY